MARNRPGSKRGFGWDETTQSLDVFSNGEIVEKMGGEQAVLTESATQLYRLGTRMQLPDGRVYRYCHAHATNGVARSYLGCQNLNSYKQDGSEDYWQGTLSAESVAGATTLTTLDTTSAHVADFFKDGFVYLRPTSAAQTFMRVKSNTAGGTSITFTLYEPLKYTCASAGVIMAVPSIYSKVSRVHGGGTTQASTVCVANFAPITADYYFWGQTWGECMGTMSEGDASGSYEDRLVFSYDGSIKLAPAVTASNVNQLAGTNAMFCTDAQANGLLFYNLEISP